MSFPVSYNFEVCYAGLDPDQESARGACGEVPLGRLWDFALVLRSIIV